MDSGDSVVSVFVDDRNDDVDLPPLSDYISGLYAYRRLDPAALVEINLLPDRLDSVIVYFIPSIYEVPINLNFRLPDKSIRIFISVEKSRIMIYYCQV